MRRGQSDRTQEFSPTFSPAGGFNGFVCNAGRQLTTISCYDSGGGGVGYLASLTDDDGSLLAKTQGTAHTTVCWDELNRLKTSVQTVSVITNASVAYASNSYGRGLSFFVCMSQLSNQLSTILVLG